MGEVTSAEVGTIASRGLSDPASLTLDEIKAVCASALTQRPDVVDEAEYVPEPHPFDGVVVDDLPNIVVDEEGFKVARFHFFRDAEGYVDGINGQFPCAEYSIEERVLSTAVEPQPVAAIAEPVQTGDTRPPPRPLYQRAALLIRSLMTDLRVVDHHIRPHGERVIVASEVVTELEGLG